MFNNNFININELFTSLLILGSQIINPENFLELIKEYLPEKKKEEKNIFLTKEEFVELPFWFETDEYLNALKDSNERESYLDINLENLEIEKNNTNNYEQKPLKINAIKEAIFEINSEDGLLELNRIFVLLNKLNTISLSKNNINNIIDSEKNSSNKKLNNDASYLDLTIKKEENINTSLGESNKNDLTISKLNLESKITSSLQSGNKNKNYDERSKEKINNVFNILFN